MLFCIYSTLSTVLVTLGLVLGVSIWIYKSSGGPKKFSLRKKKWEKDVVYLMQFPCVPNTRTISPFSLKVETWLRLHKIKYENVYTMQSGSKGQIPYIELNGEEIPDSNVILDKLEEYFEVERVENDREEAVAHAVTVMLENHTAKAGFYWRYGHNIEEFLTKVCLWTFPQQAITISKYFQPTLTKIGTYCHGLGRHNLKEINHFSCQDLKAISDLLSQKKFFHGDELARIDCTLFGHLVQFLDIPMDFPQKKFMQDSCENLIDHVERIREELWPDWNQMCDKNCMEGFKAEDYIKAMA